MPDREWRSGCEARIAPARGTTRSDQLLTSETVEATADEKAEAAKRSSGSATAPGTCRTLAKKPTGAAAAPVRHAVAAAKQVAHAAPRSQAGPHTPSAMMTAVPNKPIRPA